MCAKEACNQSTRLLNDSCISNFRNVKHAKLFHRETERKKEGTQSMRISVVRTSHEKYCMHIKWMPLVAAAVVVAFFAAVSQDLLWRCEFSAAFCPIVHVFVSRLMKRKRSHTEKQRKKKHIVRSNTPNEISFECRCVRLRPGQKLSEAHSISLTVAFVCSSFWCSSSSFCFHFILIICMWLD